MVKTGLVSRLVRALWIEITETSNSLNYEVSRLVRALWIEIFHSFCKILDVCVEARESLVD